MADFSEAAKLLKGMPVEGDAMAAILCQDDHLRGSRVTTPCMPAACPVKAGGCGWSQKLQKLGMFKEAAPRSILEPKENPIPPSFSLQYCLLTKLNIVPTCQGGNGYRSSSIVTEKAMDCAFATIAVI